MLGALILELKPSGCPPLDDSLAIEEDLGEWSTVKSRRCRKKQYSFSSTNKPKHSQMNRGPHAHRN